VTQLMGSGAIRQSTLVFRGFLMSFRVRMVSRGSQIATAADGGDSSISHPAKPLVKYFLVAPLAQW
jgi:hypothetical protein